MWNSIAHVRERGAQAWQKFRLSRVDFRGRRFDRKPAGAIDLGKFGQAAAARRPFHLKSIALDRFSIEVRPDGKGVDDFSAGLFHAAEFEKGPDDGEARFFSEFPLRRVAWIFVVVDLAFWNRPSAGVLFGPERTAGMHEEYLGLCLAHAIHEKTGGLLRHEFTEIRFADAASAIPAARGDRRPRSNAHFRPMKWLLCFMLVAIGAVVRGADEPAERRVFDARRYHLGIAGLPEWQEFENSTPHGRQLELEFNARANVRACTLFLRQRDVKTAWNVVLNGRKIGELETLSQSLVRALVVPPGTLQDGRNRLLIARIPSAMLDDIVVGEIALDLRPRDAVLTESALEVAVTDEEHGGGLPCRLTLVDAEHALAPLRPADGQQLAVRTGVVYTGDGRARIGVAPGSYVVHASRGFEYSVATQSLTIAAGETKTIALRIRREVPTPGLVACDSHIHTLTYSKHGDATVDERMLTIAGEGIELAVATDHNHHTDYTEAAARTGMRRHFSSVVGNEVTTAVGHFNAFPVRADGAVPDARLTDWTQLLRNIRTLTGAQVITLNHPRDVHQNFTPFAPANFDARTGELKSVSRFDCDAIEVVTSAATQSDVMTLYHDWFALLNHGFRIAAVGASDTHHVSEFILGQARTYVVSGAIDPAKIDIDEVCASYRAGRLLVSMGLLTQMTVDEHFNVGDLATGLGDTLRVSVTVLGPSWVEADRVELFANGIKIREQAIQPGRAPEKARITWTIARPKHDVHLVAIATGPGVTAPYWEIARPYQAASKIFNPRVVGSTNPIWIDGDGDGRFTAARAYAVALLQQVGGDAAKLKPALTGYDEAVAVQAADLAAQAAAERKP